MKIILLSAIATLLLSGASFAEDTDQTLADAPQEYILSLLADCKEYAVEDEVEKKELNSYLLACINDSLAESYYKPIKTLPVEG